jgi:succinate dehydrogenase / fumarate reductase cytochrome b subunit
MKPKRPKHLNLMQIRLPLPGFVSILHRVSGALLFLAIPLLLSLFQRSLASPETFAALRDCLSAPLAKLILLGLLWAYLHHFCAGLRFLALDLHWGVALPAARATSWAVLVVSLGLTAILGALLW